VAPFDVALDYPRTVAGTEMATYIDWMAACSLISVTGCPALSVPAAFTAGGLPVGIQVVGPHRQDRTVLSVGYAIEQACGAGLRAPVREPGTRAATGVTRAGDG
jgi:amidase